MFDLGDWLISVGDQLNKADLNLEQLFAAAQMLGSGNMPLKAIVSENEEQLATFRPFDPVEVAATFGALLTVPELQSNCIRLETLGHIALAFCRGKKKPQSTDISRWFSEFGEGSPGRMEDPAEDVFVSNIATPRGNFRILEGIWESAGFYVQRIVNVVEGMPPGGGYERLRESIYALLALSDLVCERAHLTRYQLGNQNPEESLPGKLANSICALRRRVRFSPDELKVHGISIEALDDFIFDPADRTKLLDESIGNSTLERFPIIARDKELLLALPTAMSVTIRRFVIERMTAGGMRDALANGLAREYGNVFAKIPLLGGKSGAPIEFLRTKNGLVAGAMTPVDIGRHLNFVFFGETLNNIENTGIVGFQPDLGGLADDVDAWIDHAYDESRKDPNFRDGLTLVVGCGIGRGAIDFLNDKPRPNWRIEFLSAADLYTLSWVHDFKPLSLWRQLDAQEKVEAHGVQLHNVNGLLNMVAWARKLDGHLVPHGSLPDDFATGDIQHGIVIEQNSLRDLRHEVATFWDSHVEQDVQGRWLKVRKDGESVFEEDRQRPIYGSEERIGRWMPGVFLTPARAWWGAIDVSEDTSGHHAYQRWKMLMVWLARAAPVLERALTGLPSGPLLWHAKFDGAVGEFEDDPKAVSFEEAKADIQVNVDVANRTVLLVIGNRYEAANFNVENIAERAFVERAVEGFAELAGASLASTQRDALVNAIVPDTAARETHAFRVRQFRDYVRESVPKSPLIIDRDDDAAFRLGLGWRVRKREDGGDICGKENCTAFINSVVRLIEDELCEELRQYDRRATLLFALKNHESAAVERDWWNRTASAVLALRTDKEAARKSIANHEFQLNGAFQASRLLVEFALCECPLAEGREPGRLDFSRLIAKVAFIQHVGGWSDAIRWDVMEPRVKVSAMGDIFVNHDFIDNVMAPYGRAGSDVRVDDAVKNYARNLGEPEYQPSAKGTLDDEFLEAWKDEFGASFDETRQFLDAIDNLGHQAKKAVIELPKSTLLNAKFDGKTLPPEVTAALVEAFTLKSRRSWREIPAGYKEQDIHPWRFRRRLTTLRKPFVQVDDAEDPTMIVVPGLVRDAFGYMLGNYYRGDFPQRQLKSRMSAWAGKSSDRQGKEFSNEVADRLKELGWKAEPEVKITKLLRKGFDQNYGDVDVLAWNPDTGRVLIIECKDLQYRKTFGEIAEQLSDFRGEVGRDGKPDDLLRHLNRIELISQHLPELAAYIGFTQAPKLESHLAFKNPVPMQFALKRMEDRVRIHTFANLSDLSLPADKSTSSEEPT